MLVRLPMILLLSAAVACGGPPRSVAPPSSEARELYELGPMAPFAWLLGDWRSETGELHWVGAGDKVYGIAFDRAFRQGFEVMILEEERDPGHREGIPWLQMYDGPESRFGVSTHREANLARFGPGTAEGAPFELTLSRADDQLQIARQRTTAKGVLGAPEISRFRPYAGERAAEVEQADRALAAAVNDPSHNSPSTSGRAWAAAFAPDGAYWCERCVGGAPGRASEADLSPRNSPGRFDWVPIASRRAGDLAFTVGHMSYRPRLLPGVWRGTYVTIWQRRGDDSWSMLFYTRRAAPAELKEPQS